MNPESLLKLAKIVLTLKARVKCPVCLDFAENTVELWCTHKFCNNCLQLLRLQPSPQCPLCKVPINKRSAVYKDQFVDNLSKFVDQTCQLIKETYAHEVGELNTTKDKLQEIINTAPRDSYVATSSKVPISTVFKKPPESAFDNLMGQHRCYTNKNRQTALKEKPKVLHFSDNDNRTKIINWLNDNQQKLDSLTQSQSVINISDDEADFELPSISQVPYYPKQKPSNRLRSQSLILARNLTEPLLKRYRSLTQGLNEDDYDIEEVHSETLVKQVERKVLQDMLEDECLANMDHFAEQSKSKLKKGKTSSKRGKTPVGKTKISNIPNSGSSSGWERIKDVKKSIKKAVKEPRKLNISLQETNNTKTSPKGEEYLLDTTTPKTKKLPNGYSKKSTEKVKTNVTSLQKGTTDNKENESCIKADKQANIENEATNQTFNLSAIENYFEKNMAKVKVTPGKNTSSEINIDITDNSRRTSTDSNLQNRKSTDKENTSAKDGSVDGEETFSMDTQITPQSANQRNTVCYVAPVPKEFNDIDSIAIRMTDNLQCCIFSATNLQSELAQSLVECFTNLKTYIDKIQLHRSNKVQQEMQTSQINPVTKIIKATQTDKPHFTCQGAQTSTPPPKNVLSKYIQTSQTLLKDTEVQTDLAVYVDQGIQATDHLSTTKVTKEKSVEKVITHLYRYSLSPPDLSKDGLKNKSITTKIKSLTQSFMLEKPEDKKNVISTKTSQSSTVDNQEQHLSIDSPQPSRSKSRNLSQESLLMCSVGPTAADKKINRKLAFTETQNRSFKRIRRPASDSESDEDGKPIKRRLVRDDLTVEFIDTEIGSKDITQNKAAATPESEKIDYDKYLMEVMARYGTPPPEKTSKDERHIRSGIKTSKLSPKKQNSQESSQPKSQKRKSQGPKRASQKDSGDHIFTAHGAFEENLDKFDKEIFDYEHTTIPFSTEHDLVENTPILSPKPKIPRLQASKSNKKENNRDCMKQPLQILSKGSASTSNIPKPLHEPSLIPLTQRDPSTLNRNIPSQTEKCSDDVAGILEDLRNDDDFFKSNMEYDEKTHENKSSRRKEKPDAMALEEEKVDEEVTNVTQDNIDKIVESLNGFEDDDDIEAELEKISFTAEQRKLGESNKTRIKILENIKLKSQDRKDPESPLFNVVESSDVSDDDIVETTPQKKRLSDNDRSPNNFEELEMSSLGINNVDLCLPPPPGFGDDVETSPIPDDDRESPINDKDCQMVEGNKSSLTPDSLTDFIVTPDTMMYREKAATTQNESSQLSLTFKPAFLTPNEPPKEKPARFNSTPRISQILASDPDDIFSPITKSTIKFTPPKYTPLVSTSRPSTKKSSLMTSTPNQKSILNYVKHSQDNPTSSQQSAKPCIMWSRIINKDLTVFAQLEVKKLTTSATSFNPRVTHLVVLVDEKGQIVSHTAKILIAIAAGLWIVRYEWARDCLKFNRIVPEEPYEALDTSGVPGPQISRLTRDTNPLFKDFRFYCAAPILTIPKAELENILRLSGGEVAKSLDDFLRNDGKVNIIVTESSASEDTEQFENLLQVYKAVTIDMEWLTKCIGQYKLVSFRAFLVSGDDSNICDLGYPQALLESVPFTLTGAM